MLSFTIPTKLGVHCPLCTLGTGTAVAIALWFGINKAVVALFVGAFAIALGLWMNRSLTRRFTKTQRNLLLILIFLLTVLPALPFLSIKEAVYIDFGGEYGTLLNRTYLIDLSLIASLLGAGIVLISPYLNRIIRARLNLNLPYQKTLITFVLLIIVGTIIQLTLPTIMKII